MEILDYPECISEYRFKDPVTDRPPFFEDNGRCPFCGLDTTRSHGEGKLVFDPDDKLRRDDVHHSLSVRSCQCLLLGRAIARARSVSAWLSALNRGTCCAAFPALLRGEGAPPAPALARGWIPWWLLDMSRS